MNQRLILSKEMWAGAIFLAFGIAAVMLSSAYKMGTITEMGPAYFPTILGILLIFLGAFSCGRVIWLNHGTPIERVMIRPMLLIPISAACFAFLVERAGLVIAVVASSLLACLGGRIFRIGEALVIAVVLAVFSSVLFIYLLGLPLDLGPSEW
jgi:hypothetical protein